mmetsp:Transcript_7033/g.26568  ORF Transcript_7033/g.26568 Transcript_7033/m.26568 type:complete len:500 (-) Transcript_7033:503-2002(-)
MNSAASFAFPKDSEVVRLTRSPITEGDKLPKPPSSTMPSRDFKSGISVASSVKSSSSICDEKSASTKYASFRNWKSIAPNSAFNSSTSPAVSGVSRLGGTNASSSSCDRMRSISSCSVRTAKTRRRSRTWSSRMRMLFARRTRDSESLPDPMTLSLSVDASFKSLSQSWTSNVSANTRVARSSKRETAVGKSLIRSSTVYIPSIPPFRRTQTPFVYSAADAAALSGFSRNFETPVFINPRALFALPETRATVLTTGRGSLSIALPVCSAASCSVSCAFFNSIRVVSRSVYGNETLSKLADRSFSCLVLKSTRVPMARSQTLARETSPKPKMSPPASFVAANNTERHFSRTCTCRSTSKISSMTSSYLSIKCASSPRASTGGELSLDRDGDDTSAPAFSSESPFSGISRVTVSAASRIAKYKRFLATNAFSLLSREFASRSASSSVVITTLLAFPRAGSAARGEVFFPELEDPDPPCPSLASAFDTAKRGRRSVFRGLGL